MGYKLYTGLQIRKQVEFFSVPSHNWNPSYAAAYLNMW